MPMHSFIFLDVLVLLYSFLSFPFFFPFYFNPLRITILCHTRDPMDTHLDPFRLSTYSSIYQEYRIQNIKYRIPNTVYQEDQNH
ncbi:hypothetical protein P280DRAFT_96831 [Massarina eburnea CBS 473.64]|uniref:Uncharacterized protein n=1 Tax=Massarina eburnea CBS 473.64 TaxID=1395130 RepID=A0A6A6RTV1_9PLEO|nr:hypothetical protein P280DRAFT_96831 [Massarina eburnea CBS 473.64]